MGLDGVELIMWIEEEFEIQIADDDAERMRTVGDLIDHIIQRVDLDPQRVEDRVRAMVAEQMRINPSRVHRASNFVRDLGF